MRSQRDDLGWSGRFVAALIRTLPKNLKHQFGDDLLSAFLDERDDAVRSAAPLVRGIRTLQITLRVSWNVMKSGVAEHIRVRRPKRAPSRERNTMLDAPLADLRYAIRGLAKSRGFAATAIATLALGIGATATMFSVIRGILLQPLPFHEPDELVGVWHDVPGRGSGTYPLSPGTYFTYRDHNRVFVDVGLWRFTNTTVTGLDEPERVRLMQVTDGTFPILGVQPLYGRLFTAADDDPGAPRTLMLGNSYWQRRFGSDPDVIGRSITLSGVTWEIIGVLPPDIGYLGEDPAGAVTLRFDRSRVGTGNFSFQGLARLRPGVTLAEANADIARMLPMAPELFPRGPTAAELAESRFGPDVHPLIQDEIGNISRVLFVLFGAVGVVLLVACVNVANLFLVRAETRQREIAIRAAIGAGVGRIARQLLAESVVLGLMSGAIGLGLAYAGLGVLVRLAPETLPRVDQIAITPAVVLFTVGVAVAAGIVFGLFPLVRFSKTSDLARALGAGRRASGDGRASIRVRYGLTATEVALALVLLVGSGLMIQSFRALSNVDPGFHQPEEVLTMRIVVTSREAPDVLEAASLHEQLLRSIGEISEVVSVGAASAVTMEGFTSNNGVEMEDFPTPEGQLSPLRRYKWVTPGYHSTMGNDVLAGRVISWDDIHSRANVVVVSANFAAEYWPTPVGALGKRLRDGSSGWYEIVGVVGNEYDNGVDRDPPTIVYWPYLMPQFWSSPWVRRTLSYAIRVRATQVENVLPRVRDVVWSINPNLALANPQTLDDILARSMARTSFTLVMLSIAAGVTLAVGMVGIYGVISHIVVQRTREIGVRMALGARRGNVQLLVVRQGAAVAFAGAVIGLVAAAGLTRFMSALLYGVSPADPVTYTSVTAVVISTALLASYIPARRAAAVDPVEALRAE